MSFTTRCPACGTMFKVVPDQLKISDGWVRCGHCSDVFDATLHLENWTAPAPAPAPAPVPIPTPVPVPAAATSETVTVVRPLSPLAQPVPVAPASFVPTAIQRVERPTVPLVKTPDPVQPAAALDVEPVPSPEPRPRLSGLPAPSLRDNWLGEKSVTPPFRKPIAAPAESPPSSANNTATGALVGDTDKPAPTVDAALVVPSMVSNLKSGDSSTAALASDEAIAESEAAAARRVGADDWTSADDDADDDASMDDSTDADLDLGSVPEDWMTRAPAPAPVSVPVPPIEPSQQPAPVSPASTPVSGNREWDESDFHDELARFTSARSDAERAIASEVEQTSRFEWTEPPAEEPPRVEILKEPEDEIEVTVVEPGFVVQARRQAYWRSPAMRGVLLMTMLLLTLLLVAQWAVHERDRLAARYPASMPALRWLCQPMQCDLAAPRRIEAVVIDSSNLVRRLGNFYAFDFVLKNSEPMAVAMPALELSLTDVSDSVIARRVFLSQNLPGAPPVVPALGTVAVSLRLSLSESSTGAMTGYRALVFYP